MDIVRVEPEFISGLAGQSAFTKYDQNLAGKLAVANSDVIYDSQGTVKTNNNYLDKFNVNTVNTFDYNSTNLIHGAKGMVFGKFTGRYAQLHNYTNGSPNYSYEITMFNPILDITSTPTSAKYNTHYFDKDRKFEFGDYISGDIIAVADTGNVTGYVWRDFRVFNESKSYFPHTDADYDDFNFQETGKRQQDWDIYFKDATEPLKFITEYRRLHNITVSTPWYGYGYKPAKIRTVSSTTPFDWWVGAYPATKILVSRVPSLYQNIVSYGVCYKAAPAPTNSNPEAPPTVSDSKIVGTTGNDFEIGSLLPNTRYRFAIYEEVTAGVYEYAQVYTHVTGASKLPVKLLSPSLLSVSYNTLNVSTHAYSLEYPILELGVCYGITPNPTVDGTKKYLTPTNYKDQFGHSQFILDNLQSGRFYYTRPYAKYQDGANTIVVYGDIQNLMQTESYPYKAGYTTKVEPTTIQIYSGTQPDKTETTASIRTSIYHDGGATITEAGIYFGKEQNPWSNPANKIKYTGEFTIEGTVKSFFTNLTGLQPNTTYYYTPYGVNSKGENRDEAYIYSFTTYDYPSISITDTIRISTTSTDVKISALSSGIGTISEVGVVYSYQTQLPVHTDNLTKVAGSLIGKYTITLNGLLSNETYYVRPFIKRTINGTPNIYYGTAVSFKLTYIAPVRELATIESPTQVQLQPASDYKFTLSANIALKGTSAITEKGFIIAPNTSAPVDIFIPITSDVNALPTGWSKVVVPLKGNGDDSGLMTSTSVLPTGTNRIAAYAINAAGTCISSTIMFACVEIPVIPTIIFTLTPSGVDADSALLFGKLTGDTRTIITEQGISYKKTADSEYTDISIPSNQLPKAINGAVYSVEAQGLVSDTNYHYKAYAKVQGETERIEGILQTFKTNSTSIPIPTGALSVSTNDLGVKSFMSLSNYTDILEKGIVYKPLVDGSAYSLSANDTKVVIPDDILSTQINLTPGKYLMGVYVKTTKGISILNNTVEEVNYKYTVIPSIANPGDYQYGMVDGLYQTHTEEFKPPTDPAPVEGDTYTYKDKTWQYTKNGWVKKDGYSELLMKINTINTIVSNKEVEDAVNAKDPVNLRQLQQYTEASRQTTQRVINMYYGLHLADVLKYINTVGDATEDFPYTINFYNHSYTVNLTTFTEKIVFPPHVYINFVGDINWGNFFGIGDTGFDLFTGSRLFIGFDFSKTATGSIIRSGLPTNMNSMFFGDIDTVAQDVEDYPTMITNIATYFPNKYGIVWAGGDPAVNNGNNKLYLLKLGTEAIDITPDFSACDFGNCNLSQARFYGAKMLNATFNNANLNHAKLKNADLSYATMTDANLAYSNLQNANLSNVNLSGSNLRYSYMKGANLDSIQVDGATDFRGAVLNEAINMPATLDTKSKFIAVVGASNVNAETIWIDGTSILS